MSNKIKVDKSNWKLTRLGEIADDISERVNNPSESEYDKFVGLDCFVTSELKINKWSPTESLQSSAKVFKKGDVLFARRNVYLKRASLVDFDGCCSGDAFVLRENHNKIVPGFLAFIVNSESLWTYANSNAEGTMSKRVKWRDLANYEFLLPPKEEQSRLAELLWAMDEVIEKDKVLLERVNEYKMSKAKELINHLNEEKKLSEIAEIIMGQSPNGKSYNENGNGMPFIQGNAEFSDKGPINKLFTTEPNKIAEESDILISVRAPVGDLNVAQKKFCIGRGLAAIRLKDKSLNPFVFEYLKGNQNEFDRLGTGSTFKAINKDILTNFKIKLDTDSKKNEELVLFYTNLNQNIENLKSKIASSESLQRSLINEVF